MQKLQRCLYQEDGNVESALVLIPMLILFLISAQLIAATNIRNAEMALAQGDASARAISHQYQLGDEVSIMVKKVDLGKRQIDFTLVK